MSFSNADTAMRNTLKKTSERIKDTEEAKRYYKAAIALWEIEVEKERGKNWFFIFRIMDFFFRKLVEFYESFFVEKWELNILIEFIIYFIIAMIMNYIFFYYWTNSGIVIILELSLRVGEVVTRMAHNHKIASANLAPALHKRK